MKIIVFFIVVLLSASAAVAQTQPQPTPHERLSPGNCSWAARTDGSGRGRRAMKFRNAKDGKTYKMYNNGKAITIPAWFEFTCGLNKLVPAQPPEDNPIEGAEDMIVKLTGYVMAVKFMRDGDHDLHVELGATPDWNSDHVVVEMSPGADYCDARANLWKIAEKAGCKTDECILEKPVRVEVTGYVLAGTAPKETTDYCNYVSPRGLKDAAHSPRVRGVWRLQPVLKLKKK